MCIIHAHYSYLLSTTKIEMLNLIYDISELKKFKRTMDCELNFEEIAIYLKTKLYHSPKALLSTASI